ncbi:MAG: Trehalose-6-phosphate phosphatase [uncultured Acidimicrobiales bacterium]|uniref:Trehalose 6-phosphate phosphatase n=1 Tax=uncultured Acidimicrobiales bacterium TaxID=310071 RepID=A0A6J4IP47_9ACTN|nr:MAG: Trehalose-6-phosphate phosphatase [uncultured Acidimicrobiales bacterium]
MRAVPAPDPLDTWVAHAVEKPGATGIFTDFDGTLAPIVDDPAAARAVDGAVDALHRLAARFGVVAVISGRPVRFLMDRLELSTRPQATNLVVAGLYGLERARGSAVELHPDAGRWAEAVADAAARAEADAPPDVLVERKGLSFTLHVRTSPMSADWARSWIEACAAATGLVSHPARMSYELRPPVEIDKGTVVAELLDDMSAGCFLGDDLGDLPAFDALDRLTADRGLAGLKVGVRSAEAPQELIERADVLVEGPVGSAQLLERLGLDGA